VNILPKCLWVKKHVLPLKWESQQALPNRYVWSIKYIKEDGSVSAVHQVVVGWMNMKLRKIVELPNEIVVSCLKKVA